MDVTFKVRNIDKETNRPVLQSRNNGSTTINGSVELA
jgi:hypothetical protein